MLSTYLNLQLPQQEPGSSQPQATQEMMVQIVNDPQTSSTSTSIVKGRPAYGIVYHPPDDPKAKNDSKEKV